MSSSTLVRRSAWAGLVGGLLWTALPVGTVAASIQDTQPGTPAHLGVAALYWLLAVLPPALLLLGLVGLRALHGGAYGRLGRAGFLASFAGLALMFVGNAVEVASVTSSGSESSAGHASFLLGFLVLLGGSAPLGVAVIRIRRDLFWRIGGSCSSAPCRSASCS